MAWNDPSDIQAAYADAFTAAERLQALGLPVGYPDGTLRPGEPLQGARLIFAMAKLAEYLEILLDANLVESRANAARSVVHLQTDQGLGAGVLIRPDGLLITAHHVIAGASRIDAQFPGWEGQEHAWPDVKVLLERPEVDLALCRVVWSAMAQAEAFPFAPVATSDAAAAPGRLVWVIGSPFGEQGRSSLGTIGNTPVVNNYYTANQVLVSVSGFVNPGNSGGGLFGVDGTLLGIVVMKYLDAEGMAYAVPASEILETIARARAAGLVLP